VKEDKVERDRDRQRQKEKQGQGRLGTGMHRIGAHGTEGSISVAALAFVPRHCSVLFWKLTQG